MGKFEAAATSAKEAELGRLEQQAAKALADKKYAMAESEAQKKTVEAQTDELNKLRVERAKLQAESKQQANRMQKFEQDMQAKQQAKSDMQSQLEEHSEKSTFMKEELNKKDEELQAAKRREEELH